MNSSTSSSGSAAAGTNTSSLPSTSATSSNGIVPSLAITTLRYVYEQQGLWQMATLHFWQRFLDRPAVTDEDGTAEEAAPDWQPSADGITAPAERSASSLRTWFHAIVLPQWTRHARHDDIERGSGPHDYMALMALMRERNGFQHYGDEVHVSELGAIASDWRELRSERRRAEVEAQRSTVDLLDLTVSYELCSPEERSAGTLLAAEEVRKRLWERRQRAVATNDVDDEDDSDNEAAFAQYKVAVRQQLAANVVQEEEQRPTHRVTVSMITLQRPTSPAAPPVTPLPLPLPNVDYTTSPPVAVRPPAPPAIAAQRRRQQLHRHLVDENTNRLSRFLDALPPVERQLEIDYLQRYMSRNQRHGGPAQLTQLQRQLWHRLPISSVTGMPRNSPARRRVGVRRGAAASVRGPRQNATTPRRPASTADESSPVLGRPLTPRGYLYVSPGARRADENRSRMSSETPPPAATTTTLPPLAASTPDAVVVLHRPSVGVRTRSSSLVRPASRAPSLQTIQEGDTPTNTQSSSGNGGSSTASGRRYAPATPDSNGSPSTRMGS